MCQWPIVIDVCCYPCNNLLWLPWNWEQILKLKEGIIFPPFYYRSFLYLYFMVVLAGTCGRSALLTDFVIAEKVSALGFLLLSAVYISSGISASSGHHFWSGHFWLDPYFDPFFHLFIQPPVVWQRFMEHLGYCNLLQRKMSYLLWQHLQKGWVHTSLGKKFESFFKNQHWYLVCNHL